MSEATKGIAWMLLTGLLFVAMTGLVRHLGSDMHAVQTAFIRYAFGCLLFVPLYWQLLRERRRPARLRLHLLRSAVHSVGVMLWFYAMAHIPMAEVTAIGFTAPLFTTIGAALFLGERLQARRVGALLVGFAGTLIILRPGAEAIQPGALAQLAAAPLFACSFIIAKLLSRSESSAAIVAWLSLFVTLALAPLAALVWRPPTAIELGWLFILALFATAGHYTLARAMRHAELGMLQPFSFLQLVWASLVGLYVFGEEPETWTWVGGGIIVASATYITHREARARRESAPAHDR